MQLPFPVTAPEEPTEPIGKSLVVYFSATGHTKVLAEKLAKTTGSDLFEIVPEQAYTSEDLDYSNSDCRANREQKEEQARHAIASTPEHWEDYDTVYIGYPIWWGTAPKIILAFLETYDCSGKTVLPFCTSGGSGIASSVSVIRAACPGADVKDGFRGTSAATEEQIREWVVSCGTAAESSLPSGANP